MSQHDHDHADDEQLLHIVIGGELRHLGEPTFRDVSKIEFVGAYPNYAEARKADIEMERASRTLDLTGILPAIYLTRARKTD